MIGIKHESIRRDLMLIIMSITLLSILLTTVSMSIIGYVNLLADIEDDMHRAASVVGDRNASLLQYANIPNIRRKAFVNLNVFSDDKSIHLTCLYNANHELVAFYDQKQQPINDLAVSSDVSDDEFTIRTEKHLADYANDCVDPATAPQVRFTPETLEVMHPIVMQSKLNNPFTNGQGNIAGYIYIKSGLDQMDRFATGQLVAAVFIVIAILGICYLLSLKLQSSISQPISKLSEATRNVTLYKDYAVRVNSNEEKYSTEINQLIDSFNSMLSEIEERDGKLMRKNIELERAKEAAEAASVAKSQFLANISHELRTPLNAIIGFSSIIVNQLFGALGNDKYREYGLDIHDSGVHLLDIINDILDLSKAEAGKLKLKLEKVDVGSAIGKCVTILTERAREGEVALRLHMPDTLPQLVADRVRFIQIMLNVMSNAVKFTNPGGSVNVYVELEEVQSGVHYFTFRVTDTGIGMRKADIDTAFQTFGQIDSGLNRRYEGTGLGLPLTKKLVELHNATIRIESELGKGTTVIIRFISDPSLLD